MQAFVLLSPVLSLCIRWQPAAEAADPRYVGDTAGHSGAKFGVYAADAHESNDTEEKVIEKRVTMDGLRQQWGL